MKIIPKKNIEVKIQIKFMDKITWNSIWFSSKIALEVLCKSKYEINILPLCRKFKNEGLLMCFLRNNSSIKNFFVSFFKSCTTATWVSKFKVWNFLFNFEKKEVMFSLPVSFDKEFSNNMKRISSRSIISRSRIL